MSIDLTSEDLTGAGLLTLRHLRGMSQQQVAYEAEISPTTLSRFENGKKASMETLGRILAVYGLQMRDLIDIVHDISAYHERMKTSVSGHGSVFG